MSKHRIEQLERQLDGLNRQFERQVVEASNRAQHLETVLSRITVEQVFIRIGGDREVRIGLWQHPRTGPVFSQLAEPYSPPEPWPSYPSGLLWAVSLADFEWEYDEQLSTNRCQVWREVPKEES